MSCADLYREVLVVRGKLSPTVFRSHDLFKFWEISDDISETVQDRDILAMED